MFAVKVLLPIAVLCAFASGSAAQVTSRFYLPKSTFAHGEPVFLYLEFLNNGPGTAELNFADPDQPFCSGVSISVSGDAASGHTCPFSGDDGCVMNGQFETEHLQAAKTYTVRFLLNFKHDINAPGEYSVEAKFLAFPLRLNGDTTVTEQTEAKLDFRVDAMPVDPSVWKPWVEQLRTPDLEQRLEAAKTFASMAPLSLEETLLKFADDPAFRRYAPLALQRLHTGRSMQALAELFSDLPLTNEGVRAAEYLAASNDRKWYPVLLDFAARNAGNASYLGYAAELGAENILPRLVALENGPDTSARLAAISAMGATGSRAAIPILLGLLQSSDADVSADADIALQQLTHRTPFQATGQNEKDVYLKWPRWWEREGPTAPLYKAWQCGPLTPLP